MNREMKSDVLARVFNIKKPSEETESGAEPIATTDGWGIYSHISDGERKTIIQREFYKAGDKEPLYLTCSSNGENLEGDSDTPLIHMMGGNYNQISESFSKYFDISLPPLEAVRKIIENYLSEVNQKYMKSWQ